MCAYQATEPTAATVADASVAREFTNDYPAESQCPPEGPQKTQRHTWNAEDEAELEDAYRTRW